MHQLPEDVVRNTLRGFLMDEHDETSIQNMYNLSLVSKPMVASVALGKDAIGGMVRDGTRFSNDVTQCIDRKVRHAMRRSEPPDIDSVVLTITDEWRQTWGTFDGRLLMGYLMSKEHAVEFKESVDEWVEDIIRRIPTRESFEEDSSALHDFENEIDCCRAGCMRLIVLDETPFGDQFPNFSGDEYMYFTAIDNLFYLFCPTVCDSHKNFIPPRVDYWEMYTADINEAYFFLGADTFVYTDWGLSSPPNEVLDSIYSRRMTVEDWRKAASVSYDLGMGGLWINNMVVMMLLLMGVGYTFPTFDDVWKLCPDFFTVSNLEFVRDELCADDELIRWINTSENERCPLLLHLHKVRLFKFISPSQAHYTMKAIFELFSDNIALSDALDAVLKENQIDDTAWDDILQPPDNFPSWQDVIWSEISISPSPALNVINAYRASMRPSREEINDRSSKRVRVLDP